MTTQVADIFRVDQARSSAKPQAAMWMLVMICVVVAVAGRLAYLQRPFDSDGSMFILLGKSVCDGDRFGHDLIDNKFPSVGLMTSVCWRMFGTNWAAYVILQTTLSLTASMLLARSAARNIGEYARWPTAMASLVYLNFTVAVYGGFQLETIQIFFSIIAACSALEAIRSRSFADAFVVGLAAGCAAMLKPTGLGPVLAFGVVILFLARGPGPKGTGLLGMALLGLAIPFVVVMAYVVRVDILRDLPGIYRQISLYATQTPMRIEDFAKPLVVLVLLGYGIAVRGWVFRREQYKLDVEIESAIVWFAVIWFALEMLGAVMQRRMYSYHFLPAGAPAALLFGLLPRKEKLLPILIALAPIMLLSVA